MMEQRIETIVLPVSDVDRSLAYYRDALGWQVDVDHAPNEQFRVVQLTPPGSHCSVTFGTGLGRDDLAPGSYHGMHLVVADIVVVHDELVRRGADVGPLEHHPGQGGGAPVPGPHPERGDFMTYAELRDPDDNTWVLQERGYGAG